MISHIPDTLLCLGNPGARYAHTRHNIGFMFGQHIIKKYSSTPLQYHASLLAFLSTVTIEQKQIRIIFPDTYMNHSGQTALKVVEQCTIATEQLAIVYDEVDLPFGRQRIRINGGTAGHRGLDSIIQYLETDKIIRVRLGIGKPENGDMKNFVLQNFLDEESNYIHNRWETKWELLFSTLVTRGGQESMNKFNGGNR